MAKKHNKSRKQKPNYSKKNKGSPNIETASELEPEIKEVGKKPLRKISTQKKSRQDFFALERLT